MGPGAQAAGAALVYLLFAVWFTWPVASDPGRILFSGTGDPLGGLAFYRELVEGGHNPFAPGKLADFNAPDGQPIQWVRNLAAAPSVLSFYLLTWGLGEVAAVAVYTFAGFVLSGVGLFALARRLGARPWASLIAGWAFAFYPFAIVKAHGHWEFAHGWVIVLAVWRLIELQERATVRNGLLAGLAVCFAMWWTPYFILFAGVAYAAIAAASLLVAARARRLRTQLRGQVVAAAVVVLFLASLVGLTLSVDASIATVRTQTIEQLNTYSARPLEYLLPPASNPLVGDLTGPFLRARNHGAGTAETTLYVGISIILLAFLAVVAALRRRLAPHSRRAAVLVGVMTLAALLTSAPPQGTIAGVTVPFPSSLIFELSSTWRVYSRFVVVVMLGLTLLAALGLSELTRHRSRVAGISLLIGASVLVPLDLWTKRMGTIIDEPTPVYSTLRELPAKRVAEYPLVPSVYSEYGYLWAQKYHEKPMINSDMPDSAAEERLVSLSSLDDPATAARLAELDVSHVVVRRRPPGYGLAGPGMPTSSFRLLAEDRRAKLYEVAPDPSVADAAPLTGFGAPEIDSIGSFQWMVERSGTIGVIAPCDRCRATLTMRAGSFAQPRELSFSDERGRLLARRTVAREAPVRVPLSFDGRARVRISASPGPQSISATSGGEDPRSVSVQLRDVGLELRPAHQPRP